MWILLTAIFNLRPEVSARGCHPWTTARADGREPYYLVHLLDLFAILLFQIQKFFIMSKANFSHTIENMNLCFSEFQATPNLSASSIYLVIATLTVLPPPQLPTSPSLSPSPPELDIIFGGPVTSHLRLAGSVIVIFLLYSPHFSI